jgi:hypothetical protein
LSRLIVQLQERPLGNKIHLSILTALLVIGVLSTI